MASLTAPPKSPILAGEPLAPDVQAGVLEEFYREGTALLRGVLTRGEVAAIREVTDRWLDDPPAGHKPVFDNYMGALVLRYTQSIDRLFCDMLVHEPLLSLAEAILGPDCGFVGQNVIRSTPGGAISRWHVDDTVEFPLPPEIPRHDARIRMPVTWFSYQIVLSDIDAQEDGPTEVVPGSHYSGRNVPADLTQLVFEGRGIKPIFAKAGDVYLFNHQLWHRGAPNTGRNTRYLMQNQYSRRWCNTRFGLAQNKCALPEEALRGASTRMLRMIDRAPAK